MGVGQINKNTMNKIINSSSSKTSKHTFLNYKENILQTIGNTPLVKMNQLNSGLLPLMLAKMEAFNPGGSSKDRIGVQMINAAERLGLLKEGGTIIEPTSGNTGIGLAQVAAIRGYKVVFTMNSKVCQEKRSILKAYGAELVICPVGLEPEDPRSYYQVAERLVTETPNSFSPNQYANHYNPLAHYQTTGPEIWQDTNGEITHFVAGMGTGGTISGTARYLKEQDSTIHIIGVDIEGSLYQHFFNGTRGTANSYKTEGIGQDFLPDAMDLSLVDEVITVSDKAAYQIVRKMAKEEAWFLGSSAGAVAVAALQVAARLDEEAIIVMLMPDSGRNYLSTAFNEDWLLANNLNNVK